MVGYSDIIKQYDKLKNKVIDIGERVKNDQGIGPSSNFPTVNGAE